MGRTLKTGILLFFIACFSLRADILLENNNVKFYFDENNFSLKKLKAGDSTYYFIPQESPLWAITIFDTNSDYINLENLTRYYSIQANAEKTYEISEFSGEKSLRLKWKNIDVFGTGKISVTVTIQLKKNGESYWKIKVKNNSSRYSIFSLDFPYISFNPHYSGGKLDTFIFPSYAGCMFHNPELSTRISINISQDIGATTNNSKGTYPGNVSMQFCYLYDSKAKKGIYLSTLDKKGFIKRYNVVGKGNRIQYFIRQYPENNHLPNQDYTQSYEIVFIPFTGDWIDACKFYRDNFAKSAPWTSQGKIYERKDERKFGANIPLVIWWEISSNLDEMVDIVLDEKDFFDVDIEVHIRNSGWDKLLVNNYLSSLFIDFCQTLANYGIRTAPYTATRGWEREYWPDPRGESSVARNINNEPYYSPKWDHYIMCPFSNPWKTLYPQKVNYLLKNGGATDVYMDEYPTPKLCYQKNHSHPLGGGTYWLDGYKAMFDKIRKLNPQASMANESRCEMLIPWLDIFPAGYWQNPEGVKPFTEIGSYPIPMVACVYHDYIGFLGSAPKPWEEYNTYQFAFQQAYSFVNGNKLNIRACESKIENFPANKRRDWEYVKTLAKYIVAGSDYLYYGSWERPPELKNFPEVAVHFPEIYPEMYRMIHTTSVLAGAFKSPEGRLGLVFTNFTDQPVSGSFSIDLNFYNMPSDFYRVYELSNSGYIRQIDNFSGNHYEKYLTFKEKSVKFLIITNQQISSENKKGKKRR